MKDVVIGSAGCRHSNSSIVLVNDSGSNSATLCEIQYFAECKLIRPSSETQFFWIAAVKMFMVHPCKVWYGYPAQVWSTAPTSIGLHYVPVSSIASRVVFTKAKVDFGTHIGEDTVYIATPLNSK